MSYYVVELRTCRYLNSYITCINKKLPIKMLIFNRLFNYYSIK